MRIVLVLLLLVCLGCVRAEEAEESSKLVISDVLAGVEELDSINSLLEQLTKRKHALLHRLNLENTALGDLQAQLVPRAKVHASSPIVAFDVLRLLPASSARSRRTTSSTNAPAREAVYYTCTANAKGEISFFESNTTSEPVLQFTSSNTLRLEAGEDCAMPLLQIRKLKTGLFAGNKAFVVTLDEDQVLRAQEIPLVAGLLPRHGMGEKPLAEALVRPQVSAFALHLSPSSARNSPGLIVFATTRGELIVWDPAAAGQEQVVAGLDAPVLHISLLGNNVALALGDGQIRFATLSPFRLVPHQVSNAPPPCALNPLVFGQITNLIWMEVPNTAPHANRARFLVASTSNADLLVLDRKFAPGNALMETKTIRTSSKLMSLLLGSDSASASKRLTCSVIKRFPNWPARGLLSLPTGRFAALGSGLAHRLTVFDFTSFSPIAYLNLAHNASTAVVRGSLTEETLLLVQDGDAALTVYSMLEEMTPSQHAAALTSGGGFWDAFAAPQRLLLPGLAIMALIFQVKRYMPRMPRGAVGSDRAGANALRGFNELLFNPPARGRNRRVQHHRQQMSYAEEEAIFEEMEREQGYEREEEEEEYALPPTTSSFSREGEWSD